MRRSGVPGRLHRRSLIALVPGTLAWLAGCTALRPPEALDLSDRAVLARVQDYLNGIQTLRARFIQAANGRVDTGTAWLDRPGRLRLQYDPPSQAVLVAAHGRVTYADRATGATSSLPLSRTPLAMLLARTITLSGPVTVLSVRNTPSGPGAGAPPDLVDITLRSTDHPGQGELSLSFSRHPLQLRGLVMVDARGDVTRLQLQDVQIGVPTEDSLFERPAA